MIDKTIKNIKKKYFKTLKKYLQQKYQKKKTLRGFGGDTYSKNNSIKNVYFFCIPYI